MKRIPTLDDYQAINRQDRQENIPLVIIVDYPDMIVPESMMDERRKAMAAKLTEIIEETKIFRFSPNNTPRMTFKIDVGKMPAFEVEKILFEFKEANHPRCIIEDYLSSLDDETRAITDKVIKKVTHPKSDSSSLIDPSDLP